MKIQTMKSGHIHLTATNDEDSLRLLEILETMAGWQNDPERLSLKKRQAKKDRHPVTMEILDVE